MIFFMTIWRVRCCLFVCFFFVLFCFVLFLCFLDESKTKHFFSLNFANVYFEKKIPFRQYYSFVKLGTYVTSQLCTECSNRK